MSIEPYSMSFYLIKLTVNKINLIIGLFPFGKLWITFNKKVILFLSTLILGLYIQGIYILKVLFNKVFFNL